MQNDHTEILTKMGLSVNEAKVYLALLKKNISKVGEIVTLSGVPQKMIYYILQKLMKKGLCTLIPGKIKKYKPADPNTCIGNLISKAQKQMTLSQQMIIELKKDYEKGKNNNSTLENIELLQNADQIAEKMIYLERLAKDEVLSFNKEPYAMARRNEEELEGLKRGIIYRSIYEVSEVRKLINRSVMEMYMEAGEQVKIVEELPMKMMIFDSNTLFFALEENIISRTNFSKVIVQNSNLVKAMKELFEVYWYWQKAMTVEEFKIKYKDSMSLEAKS